MHAMPITSLLSHLGPAGSMTFEVILKVQHLPLYVHYIICTYITLYVRTLHYVICTYITLYVHTLHYMYIHYTICTHIASEMLVGKPLLYTTRYMILPLSLTGSWPLLLTKTTTETTKRACTSQSAILSYLQYTVLHTKHWYLYCMYVYIHTDVPYITCTYSAGKFIVRTEMIRKK